jgi:hypothetical protein
MKDKMSNVKLKIDLVNGLVELEGSEEFARTELPKVLELIESTSRKAAKPTAAKGSTNASQSESSNEASGLSEIADIGALIAKVKPTTHNEIVAVAAYFWAFVNKEHGVEFKTEEVLALYTGPIRRNKPARQSNLCSDTAKQSGWIRPGTKKGYWQISDDGQKWVESKLTGSATQTAA